MVTRSKTVQEMTTSKYPTDLLFDKLLIKWNSYCEFWCICLYFDVENSYCSNAGGPNCGKYRQFKAVKK
jgi:hypothetical protein